MPPYQGSICPKSSNSFIKTTVAPLFTFVDMNIEEEKDHESCPKWHRNSEKGEGLAVACRHISFTEEERQQNLAFGKTNYILNSGFTTVQLEPVNLLFFLHLCLIATFEIIVPCSHALSFFLTKCKLYDTFHSFIL